MVGYRIEIIDILYPNKWRMIIDEKYTLPDIFLLNQCKVKLWLNIEVFSMAFLREIGRNGVLY